MFDDFDEGDYEEMFGFDFDDDDDDMIRAARESLDVLSEYRLKIPRRPTWKTRDGQKIPVEQMTDSHLINSILMLERNAPIFKLQDELSLMLYIESAPDGAAMCATQELYQLMSTRPEVHLMRRESYGLLFVEACRRGLTVVAADHWGDYADHR